MKNYDDEYDDNDNDNDNDYDADDDGDDKWLISNFSGLVTGMPSDSSSSLGVSAHSDLDGCDCDDCEPRYERQDGGDIDVDDSLEPSYECQNEVGNLI